MGENELREAIIQALYRFDRDRDSAEDVANTIMDMVADYAWEVRSEAASDAIRDYEERA